MAGTGEINPHKEDTTFREEKVAIIGSGQIGGSWALLFACAGYQVVLYDVSSASLKNALDLIHQQLLETLSRGGQLRGTLTVKELLSLIQPAGSVEECVTDACWVQECVPEDLQLKKKVMTEIDDVMSSNAILSSSSSTFLPSELSRDLNNKERFLVAHPTNPPYFSRAVELVPAPWTSSVTMTRARDVMTAIGQAPISLKKEIAGYVLNRMQFAIMGESLRLVNDGVLTVDGVNKVVSAGLGRRYAFLGPFQTGHLNAEGYLNYCEKYGPSIFRVQQTFGPPVLPGGELADRIQKELERKVPLCAVPDARKEREARMATLLKLKSDMDREGD